MSCYVEAGYGVTILGAGTAADPYRVSASASYLEAGTGTNGTVSVTGDNTPSNPLRVAIDADQTVLGLDRMWVSWVGSQSDYDNLPVVRHDVMYAVDEGGLYGGGAMDNLYAGADQVLRVYRGETLIAENNSPGIDPPA